MANQKAAGPRKGPGRSPSKAKAQAAEPAPSLPPITVAKFEETGRLLERVVSENQSLFIDKGQEYKEAHRDGSRRPLTPAESAQVAAGLMGGLAEDANPVEITEEVQDSDLRAYDEPDRREILLAAGIATAPALVAAVSRMVALVEMPNDEFKEAREGDALDPAIARRVTEIDDLELAEGRKRALDALDHYAKSAGFDSGEALRLPVQAVWQALKGAMSSLVDVSPSSLLIDSAASTEDSLESTSSTD